MKNKTIYIIVFKEIDGEFRFYTNISSGRGLDYYEFVVVFNDRKKAVIRKDLLLREYADIKQLKIVRTNAKEIYDLTKGKVYDTLPFKLESQQKAKRLMQLKKELEDCRDEQKFIKVSNQTVEKLSELIAKENSARLEILKLEAEIHGDDDEEDYY